MIYYTSDLHFDHKNIIKYCNRPFSSVEEMNAALITNWNARVTDNDFVYILGDFTLEGRDRALHFLKQLKGHKTLILGNHDTFAYKEAFDTDAAGLDCVIEHKAMCKVHDPFVDKKIVLCHYPLAVWNGKEHGSLHFYGHVHNSTDKFYPYLYAIDGAFNVGADVHSWYPCTAAEIIATGKK